jgi:NAD-dependent deacetylase
VTEVLDEGLLEALTGAERVVVLTGAGMSAESGVPTFRDKQDGLWAQYRPEDLATPEAFEANPSRVWDWYQWRRDKVGSVDPHPGYYALAELQRALPGWVVVTQNVDGLHKAAGSGDVIELHGNICRTICHRTRRGIDAAWLSKNPGSPPASPHSAEGMARPDVVWFGESLPVEALERAWALSSKADVFLSVGTSALVHPAASLPMVALQGGAVLVEINPEPTPLSGKAQHCLRRSAGEVLPRLAARLL